MIKAIIGLGNPGAQYQYTRHNIGFRILDALAQEYHASWRSKDAALITEIVLDGQKIILVKPQTFMNASGAAMSMLTKQGIKPADILVIHDELELPFGHVKYKMGGSAKGHNGLKSIIQAIGQDFARLRCGIGRPDDRTHVPDYVLSRFKESPTDVETMIQQAIQEISLLLQK